MQMKSSKLYCLLANRLFRIVLPLIIFTNSNAQIYFTKSFSFPGSTEIGTNLHVFNDSLTIGVGYHQLPNESSRLSISSFDLNYNLLSTSLFIDSIYSYGPYGTFELPDSTLIISSSAYNNNEFKTYTSLICIDKNIDTLWTYHLGDSIFHVAIKPFYFENGILYLFGKCYKNNTQKAIIVAFDINSKVLIFSKTFNFTTNWGLYAFSIIYHPNRNTFLASVTAELDSIYYAPTPHLFEISKTGNLINTWIMNDTINPIENKLSYNYVDNTIMFEYQKLTASPTNFVSDGVIISILDTALQTISSNRINNSINNIVLKGGIHNPINNTYIFYNASNIYIINSSGYITSANLNYQSSTSPLSGSNYYNTYVNDSSLVFTGSIRYALGSKFELVLSTTNFNGIGCSNDPLNITQQPYNFQLNSSAISITEDSLVLRLNSTNLSKQQISLSTYLQCLSTSLENFNEQVSNQIKVYPNPFSDYILIEALNKNIESIKVMSIEGRILKSVLCENCTSYSIDLNELPSGVYFFHTQLVDKSFIVKKIVKIISQ